jgi:hypothetical protein
MTTRYSPANFLGWVIGSGTIEGKNIDIALGEASRTGVLNDLW